MPNRNSLALNLKFKVKAPAIDYYTLSLHNHNNTNHGNLNHKVCHVNLTWNDYNTIRRENCTGMRSKDTTLRWWMHMHDNALQLSPS